MKFHPSKFSLNLLKTLTAYIIAVLCIFALFYAFFGFIISFILLVLMLSSVYLYFYLQTIYIDRTIFVVKRPFKPDWFIDLSSVADLGYYLKKPSQGYIPSGYSIGLFYNTSPDPLRNKSGVVILEGWTEQDIKDLLGYIQINFLNIKHITFYDRKPAKSQENIQAS